MFSKVCLGLSLAASVAALSINTPNDIHSEGTTTLTWTSDSSDPVFSIELNHPSFHEALAIANNVNPGDNNRTITLPPLAAEDNYTLTFVNVTDINDVFATSNSFSIGAAVSSSSGSPSGSGSNSGGGSASATAPPSSSSGSQSSPSPSTSAPPNGALSVRNAPTAVIAVVGMAVAALVL
ncbi:hypothetical protein R3P38DRAFT_1460025 [Favolaschia claudopus]|uniref:Extracellular conserved serine-rich protein n=1 Tax=Favolaschia claudopus TaxID=2862362 RepID=A0AAW0DL22_9AGAR